MTPQWSQRTCSKLCPHLRAPSMGERTSRPSRKCRKRNDTICGCVVEQSQAGRETAGQEYVTHRCTKGQTSKLRCWRTTDPWLSQHRMTKQKPPAALLCRVGDNGVYYIHRLQTIESVTSCCSEGLCCMASERLNLYSFPLSGALLGLRAFHTPRRQQLSHQLHTSHPTYTNHAMHPP